MIDGMNYYIDRFGKRIGCVMLLVCAVIFIAWSSKASQSEQYHNEYADDDTLLQESDEIFSLNGITYTVDGTKKEILTSDSGEICVKVPRWEELTTVYLTEDYRHEVLHMSNDATYDKMAYEMIAAWNHEEAEEEIFRFFSSHVTNYINEDTYYEFYYMPVNGIDVYFIPCLHINSDEEESWHCIIWGDLGCGQTLKTEITQGLHGLHVEPFNIEGMVELIYSNIEIYSAEGDAIPVVYSESLPESEERETYGLSYGAVRDYKTDEYRETTVCAELIENLYAAVQEGTIEELLQQESAEVKELSIAEKMDYIKKEETGKLITYDSVFDQQREKYLMKYYLLKGLDDSKEILVHLRWSSGVWFLCEKDGTGSVKAQKEIRFFFADLSEIYFLFYQGNPYICIANRDLEGEVESVVLYDFITPDYIGTLIYMDTSSLRLCSYVRNEGTYGTGEPWYLYLGDDIDSGKEYYAILGQWEITEYLGESDYRHVENTDSEAYVREQELTQDIVDTYLGQELEMSWDRGSISVDTFGSASEYGYYYTSLENLYKVYGQPETLDMEAPVFCATIHPNVFKRDIDIIVDKNGKAAICIEGRFFRLERCEEEELRTWE